MKAAASVVFALCCLAALCGCSKSSSNSTAPSSSTPAAQKVAQANAALETILYDLAQSPTPPTRPSSLDFQTPEGLYRDALALEPANRDANFGAAVLGLLILTSDTEVNAAFDEWDQYLKGNVPFHTAASPMAPLGIPVSPIGSAASMRLPFRSVPLALVRESRMTQLAADPQLGRVQAILHDRVLPRLGQAIARLTVAAADPGYRFIVTPRMQGDANATAAEIDHTDILAFRAALSLLSAMCHVAVSYDLSFPTYDAAGIISAFTPGSGWLALTSDGAAQMGAAYTATLSAMDDVEAATHSLLAETDDQSDDVIKMTHAQAESVLAEVPNARAGFTGGWYVTANWDFDSATPDSPLLIKASALFTSPIPDWKALMPPYTVSTVEKPYRFNYFNESVTDTALVDVVTAGVNYASYSLSVYSGGTPYEYEYGPVELIAGIKRAVKRDYDRVAALPAWTGDYQGTGYSYSDLSAGAQTLSFYRDDYYSTIGTSVFIPVITWTATNYPAWVAGWSDPSAHGLLPGIGSADELMSTFGMSAAHWSQQATLDWTQYTGNNIIFSAQRGHASRPAARARVTALLR